MVSIMTAAFSYSIARIESAMIEGQAILQECHGPIRAAR